MDVSQREDPEKVQPKPVVDAQKERPKDKEPLKGDRIRAALTKLHEKFQGELGVKSAAKQDDKAEIKAKETGNEGKESGEKAKETTPPAGKDDAPSGKKADSKEDKPEKDESYARKLAQLAQKERAIQKREHALRQVAKAPAVTEPQKDKLQELKELAKRDPEAAINQLEITYDKLTNALLDKQIRPKESRDLKVEALEKQVETLTNALLQTNQSLIQKEQQGLVNDYKGKLFSHISANEDKFPLVNSEDQKQLVFDTIQGYYSEYGTELSFDEAAQKVEDFLSERFKKVIEQPKVKEKYLSNFVSKEPEKNKKPAQNQGSKANKDHTLTQERIEASGVRSRPETRKEVIERLVAESQARVRASQ